MDTPGLDAPVPALPPFEEPEGSADAVPRRLTWHTSELWIASVVVAVDQITKALIRASIPLYGKVVVIPDLLDLTHVRNTGAAFGMLNSVDFPFKTVIIALVATAALIGIGIYAAGLSPHERVARLGLALILGGAAGNLIDRLVAGHVVDFVDVYWRDYHFWAFNVADSAITIGVTVMLADMIGLGRHVSKTV
jgi:signal peptidase II